MITTAVVIIAITVLVVVSVLVADAVDARQQAARYERRRQNIRVRLEMERAAREQEQ